MGSYLGISAVLFVISLLGFSANAEVFNVGGSPGSDITQVSSMTFHFLFPKTSQPLANSLKFHCRHF